MIRHLSILAVAALAACAPQEAKPQGEQQQSFKSIPAPTQAGVVQRITSADDGRTVVVKAGTKIQAELVGVPTAGYVWTIKEAPPFLKKTGESGGPTSEAQLQPGFAGGNHWEVFFFEVTGAGEGVLKLEQRQMWDDTGPADKTFSVTVKAE